MNKWKDDSGLLVRISNIHQNEPEFLYYNKIAGFSFNNTLIKLKTGMANNQRDAWKPLNNKVISKLVEIHEQQYSIVIFSNQMDIAKGKYSKDDLKYKFDEFVKLVFKKNIPILGFFSLEKNFCQKPYTGMWKIMESLYRKNKYPLPNRDKSIFIGNLGGRRSLYRKYAKRSSDSSYIDRAFAYNVSMKYKTPEMFFNDEKIRREWKYGDYILSKEEMLQIQSESQNKEYTNVFNHGVKYFIKSSFGDLKQFLIIMVGPPKSSKSSLVNYIVDDTKDCVERKKIKPWTVIDPMSFSNKNSYSLKKCSTKITEEITYGNSVIVDGINGTTECRASYIDLVKDFDNIGILMIEMRVSLKLAKHLNHMKVEMSNDFNITPTANTSFMKFNREYERPLIKEFLDINPKRVNIIYYPFLLVNMKEFWFIYGK